MLLNCDQPSMLKNVKLLSRSLYRKEILMTTSTASSFCFCYSKKLLKGLGSGPTILRTVSQFSIYFAMP